MRPFGVFGAVSLIIVGVSGPAWAGANLQRISVSFNDAALTEVIAEFENVVGRRISVSPPLTVAERVSVTLDNVPLSQVLDRLLTARGHTWQFQGADLESSGIDAHPQLVVERVSPDSIAARLGLREGDIIISINGQDVRSRVEASDALARLEMPRIEVLRRQTGRAERLSLTLPKAIPAQ